MGDGRMVTAINCNEKSFGLYLDCIKMVITEIV